jgi:hypothetical protein
MTARQLLEAPAGHDGEQVVLTGLVRDPRVRTPPEGVEVRGVFHDRRDVGEESMHDVVEAKFVRVLRRAPQPPGTPVGPP